jgi:hypothetical protein
MRAVVTEKSLKREDSVVAEDGARTFSFRFVCVLDFVDAGTFRAQYLDVVVLDVQCLWATVRTPSPFRTR